MTLNPWQISYDGGTYKDLAVWGVCADVALDFEAKAKDTLRLRVAVDDAGAALQWQYDHTVALRNEFGAVVFSGRVGDPVRVWDGGRQWVEFPVYGPWWLLERLVFKQTRKMFAGWSRVGDPTSPPTFVNVYTAEVYVGEKADATYQTNGQQVVEVLDWVNQCWNPTRRGSGGGDATQDVVQYPSLLTYPSVNIPKSRLNGVFCHEVLVNVLRYSPDRVPWWDYSISPPRLNLTELASAGEVTVNITADQERQLKSADQFDRRLSGVVIRYKRVNVIDGTLWPEVFVDKYPATVTDFDPDASEHVIDLAGANVTRVKADVQVRPISDATGGNAALRKDFWKSFAPELSAYGVDDLSIHVDPATVDGGVNTSVYSNVLLSKAGLADWLNTMGIVGVEATVRAKATYTRYADGPGKAVPAAVHAPKELHVRVVLTNAQTNSYSSVQHSEAPEAVPVGVAQAVYNSVKDLQQAGTLSLVGDQTRIAGQRDSLRTDIRPGVKLKLVGPTLTLTNCLVQKATWEPHYGRIQVVFGPSTALDVQERVELQRVGRLRYTYNMPSGRADGTASSGTEVSLPNQTPKENTTAQHVSDTLQAATADLGTGNTGVVQKVANQGNGDQVLQVHQIITAVGTRDDSKGYLDLKLSDTKGSDGNFHGLKIQEAKMCVGDPGNQTLKRVMIIISDPY